MHLEAADFSKETVKDGASYPFQQLSLLHFHTTISCPSQDKAIFSLKRKHFLKSNTGLFVGGFQISATFLIFMSFVPLLMIELLVGTVQTSPHGFSLFWISGG